MNILSMLFKYFTPKKNIKFDEKIHQDKLQCIICTNTFDIYTEHNCLLRKANEEFCIKYTVR
jgi:hypothetical protein